MLSSQEMQVWEDIQRHWSEEAEEPRRPVPTPETRPSRAQARAEAAAFVGVRVVIVLLLFGWALAALGVAMATGLVWLLWGRRRPTRALALVTSPDPGNDRAAAREAADHP